MLAVLVEAYVLSLAALCATSDALEGALAVLERTLAQLESTTEALKAVQLNNEAHRMLLDEAATQLDAVAPLDQRR